MRSLVGLIIVTLVLGAVASCTAGGGRGTAPVGSAADGGAVTALPETTVPVQLADGAAAPAAEKPALPAGHPPVPPAGDAKGDLPSGHPPIPAANDAQPAMPAGHPPVPGANDAKPAMPAGHPPVPGANDAKPGMPAGHPPVPNAGAGAGLPSGHPQVEPVMAPPGTKGEIKIVGVQATKGGPAVGADAVLVEYYNGRGEVIGKSQTALSDQGEVTIKDVPLTFPIQPLITITHGGVEYKAPGNVMDGNNRGQRVEISVFETTEKEPAWQVRMRHVIVQPGRDGLEVTDMISVFNPEDRSWTGKAPADGGKPVTLAIPLPATATNVRTGGAFHDCCVKVADGKLIYSMAMLPGGADYQIHYTVPAADDKAAMSIVAPAATGSLFVFLPEDGSVVTSDVLKKVQAKAGANLKANSRFYTAPPQKAGEAIAFTVSGLKALKAAPAKADGATGDAGDGTGAPAPASAASAGIPRVAKVVGGVGAGAILTIGTAIMFFKTPKAATGAKL